MALQSSAVPTFHAKAPVRHPGRRVGTALDERAIHGQDAGGHGGRGVLRGQRGGGGSIQRLNHSPGEVGGIPYGREPPGGHDFGQPAACRGYYRFAQRQRVEYHSAEAFGTRGHDDDVAFAEQRVRLRDVAEQVNAIGEVELPHLGCQGLALGAVACDHPMEVRATGSGRPRRPNQGALILGRLELGDVGGDRSGAWQPELRPEVKRHGGRAASEIATTASAWRRALRRRTGKTTRRVATTRGGVLAKARKRRAQIATVTAWLLCAWMRFGGQVWASATSHHQARGSSPRAQGISRTVTPSAAARRASSLPRRVTSRCSTLGSRASSRASRRTWF